MDFDHAGVLHMLSAHEDRIQRLEAVTTDLASSVAEQNATMKAFSQQMRSLSDSVCEKLEDVSSRLSDKIGAVTEISKEIVHDSRKTEKRISKLENEEQHDEKVSDFWLKVAYTALKIGLGISGTLATLWLKHHII